MADWSKPTILSNYVLFVDEAKARDVDAISLQKTALTSPPTGSIRLLRSPVKFQEWDGAAFVDQVLAVAGGGTGSATAAGARTNFGLGTMAIQNADNINVTGGVITNVSSNGSFAQNGDAYLTRVAVNPTSGAYGVHIAGNPAVNGSFGLFVQAGTGKGDFCINVTNRQATIPGLVMRGDMTLHIQTRLIIPVGVDYWAVP
jgi:hypothetical protein